MKRLFNLLFAIILIAISYPIPNSALNNLERVTLITLYGEESTYLRDKESKVKHDTKKLKAKNH